MHKLIPTLTLTTTLAFATSGEAAPRPRQLQPTTTELSNAEFVCLSLGGIAHSSAIMRDKGLSYLDSLQRLRAIIAANPAQGAVMDWFRASAASTLRSVYEHPSVTPAQVRQGTELACLQTLERDQEPAHTTMSKDRY